jgi:site-specific recombinase XerD
MRKQEKFKVRLNLENGYYRLHITHPKFTGRIRKRLGDKTLDEAEENAMSVRYELKRKFDGQNFTKQEVEDFIERYIKLSVKRTGSFFEYMDEYLVFKEQAFNNKTKRYIEKSTIVSIRTALNYYKDFYRDNHLSTQTSSITEKSLNEFYQYLDGKHNTRVKIHHRVKGFIKYLIDEKNLAINKDYRKSVFNEEYDNQNPDDNDRALTVAEIQKLIDLRKRLLSGEAEVELKPINPQMPVELQKLNHQRLKANLTKSLDCFLFMIATGQYWADIMKSRLQFSRNGSITHVNYRRAKNHSLCKSIPIEDDGIFIGKEIIDQYGIRHGSNFPLDLSLNHFAKHLKRISKMAGIDYKLTSKMARKTFASELYFNRGLPIHYLQILLGHQNASDTEHYLRIKDQDAASEIHARIYGKAV